MVHYRSSRTTRACRSIGLRLDSADPSRHLGAAKAIATKKSIVVCGYPKSGTTWLCRLVGELLPCPLMGGWGFSSGSAIEGHGRVSDFECYTSHHTLASLASGKIGDYFKLVYIVRDPRDVAISAAHHFRVNILPIRGSNRLVAAVNSRVSRAVPYFVKRRRLIEAILYGDPSLSLWLATSWRDHYLQFRQSNVLILKYEDLLDDPMTKCVELLSYLDIRRSDGSIAEAISEQSFEKKKALFKARGPTAEYEFLRRGGTGYWRDELSSKHKKLFVDELREELVALSYAIDL